MPCGMHPTGVLYKLPRETLRACTSNCEEYGSIHPRMLPSHKSHCSHALTGEGCASAFGACILNDTLCICTVPCTRSGHFGTTPWVPGYALLYTILACLPCVQTDEHLVPFWYRHSANPLGEISTEIDARAVSTYCFLNR